MGVVRIGATRFVLYKEHAGIPLRRHERKKRCAGSRSVIYIYYTGSATPSFHLLLLHT